MTHNACCGEGFASERVKSDILVRQKHDFIDYDSSFHDQS